MLAQPVQMTIIHTLQSTVTVMTFPVRLIALQREIPNDQNSVMIYRSFIQSHYMRQLLYDAIADLSDRFSLALLFFRTILHSDQLGAGKPPTWPIVLIFEHPNVTHWEVALPDARPQGSMINIYTQGPATISLSDEALPNRPSP